MNKITMTAGFLALGAASLHAAVDAPVAGSVEAQKPWSISASLRGFYDDNYDTTPAPNQKDSFGFEVRPSAAFNLIREQTTLGLSYIYSLKYFENRAVHQTDQSHQFAGKLSHAFTERYKADVSDSFVIAQEPELLSSDNVAIARPLRSDGSNKRNTLATSFSAGVTEQTDVVIGYGNNWFDYEDHGHVGSLSSTLDRDENSANLSLRQVLLPNTVGVISYEFRAVDYSSNDPIGLLPVGAGFYAIPSDIRDNYAHFLSVGVDQRFTPTLNASARVGAQYSDYHETERLLGFDSNEWSPYADANITWTYMERSYAQLGVRHERSATDVGYYGGARPTLDMEATTVYASVSQQIASKLNGSLVASYQHATFDQGAANNLSDDYYMVGVNFTYEFTRFLAAELGYNYDRLDSDLGGIGVARSYDRNRVYMGIRATY